MTRLERIGIEAATWLVGLTGSLLAWMKYGMVPGDPFALVNHPYQPLMLHLHVLTAPALVFFLGLLARGHFLEKLTAGAHQRRRSGWTLILLSGPMILSGYAIQVATGESPRTLCIGIHLVSSGMFVLFLGVHLYRLRWDRPGPPAASVPAISGGRRDHGQGLEEFPETRYSGTRAGTVK